MFLKLLVIFIAVPLLELLVIVEVGSRIGLLATALSLLIISFSGAALAKQQGYQAIARIQREVQAGRMPGNSLIDGVLILAGALLLLTPGYLTDAAGLLLLLPPVRRLARGYAKRRLGRMVAARTVYVRGPGDPTGSAGTGREPEQRRKEIGD